MTDAKPPDLKASERIAKVLARRGVASRRAAERLIAEGRISAAGTLVTSPGTKVAADCAILLDGRPVELAAPTRLWRYHKPQGLVTTHLDPQGRPTVFDALPKDLPRVISVGRLDLTSEGLLLLTNDGALARRLELPATGWRRRYRVRVYGRVEEQALAALALGLTIEGVRYRGIEARIERYVGHNTWLVLTLTEGKNREVRRVMEQLGLKVNRLIRVGFGPFQLGSLQPGAVEEVKGKVLREQLGALLPAGPPLGAQRRGRG